MPDKKYSPSPSTPSNDTPGDLPEAAAAADRPATQPDQAPAQVTPASKS